MIGTTNFINRNIELKLIKGDILKKRSNNKLFMITGNSGIGKSRLTEKILSDFQYNKCIKVKVSARPNSDLEQGLFIRLIGSELNNYAEKNRLDHKLNNYLKSWSGSLKEYLTNIVFDDVDYLNPVNNAKVLNKIIKYNLNKGEFNVKNILHDSSHRSIQIISNYIEFFLNIESPFIINIENIQLIDYTSLELLSHLIKNTNQNYYLLEFTNNENCTPDFIIERIKDNHIEIAITDLPKLSRDDFRKIILTKELNINRMIDHVYEQFNGNIRQLSDLKIVIDKQVKYFDLDPLHDEDKINWTLLNIRNLTSNNMFVLTAIVTNKSRIHVEQLNYIHKFRDDIYININKVLDNLVERDLIRKTDMGFVEINHDSISFIVKDENYNVYLLANKMWSEYYLDFFKTNDFSIHSRHYLLTNIFYHLMQSEPVRVLNILDDIKKHILSLLYPSAVEGYINSLKTYFADSKIDSDTLRERIIYFIIDTYYETNFFTEALDFLSNIGRVTLRSKLYKVVLLNRLDKHEEVIKLTSTEMKNLHSEFPPSYALSLQLILLASLRSSLMFNKWHKLFSKVLKNVNYKHLKEYGIFLRNSEMLLSHKDSIPHIERSIKIFEELDEKEEEAYARIAYSMQLGRLGRLSEAILEAKYAQSLLIHRGMDQFLSLNNIAVIEMLNKNFTPEVKELLKQALVTAFDPFSKQNILTNLLVWNTVNKNNSVCEEIIEELIPIVNAQTDEILNRITYWDVHYYYESVNDEINSHKFKELARLCLNDDEQLWRYRFYKEEITDDNYEFLSKTKYHVDFLTYWHFEVNKELENFVVNT